MPSNRNFHIRKKNILVINVWTVMIIRGHHLHFLITSSLCLFSSFLPRPSIPLSLSYKDRSLSHSCNFAVASEVVNCWWVMGRMRSQDRNLPGSLPSSPTGRSREWNNSGRLAEDAEVTWYRRLVIHVPAIEKR